MTANKRAYYWIKLNTAYLSDVKFLKLEDKVKYHYLALYLIACESDAGGLLIQNNEPLTIDDISFLLHTSYSNIEDSIGELLKSGLLKFDNGFVIARYIDEQGPSSFGDQENKKRNDWKERQQKSRANKKIREELNKDSDKELNKEEDKESDKDIDSDIDIDKRVTRDKSVTNNTSYLSEQLKNLYDLCVDPETIKELDNDINIAAYFQAAYEISNKDSILENVKKYVNGILKIEYEDPDLPF